MTQKIFSVIMITKIGGGVMISYIPLWVTLAKRNLKKTDLLNLIGISSSTLAKLSKNEEVSLSVIIKICNALDCKIEEVIEVVKQDTV